MPTVSFHKRFFAFMSHFLVSHTNFIMAVAHHNFLSLGQQCTLTGLKPTACHLRGEHLSWSMWPAFSPVKNTFRNPSVNNRDAPVVSKKCELHKPRAKSKADMEQEEDVDVDLSKLNDEELDALFNEYGEVVRSDGESSSSLEVDEDAHSLAFAVALAEAAYEVKAAEIKVLHVKPLVYWTRFFVIATAFSRPQIDAMGKRMRDIAEERFKKIPSGDLKPNSWMLLDYGDVVVHIFLPRERTFYNLEEFYGNAAVIGLPFLSQVPR
ncbi:hypothetical protein O6H91_05G124800 [Diphasiastrum complanatum]|uniref:Uncharacterized protein n=1 Tax=Diphasiastrum complanatum TaxID=34168 RepID=A0ACC2DT35_DIPCM|nr:hypothetical protein O6H91_05G124800 [Diphasiastrum complanatum]